MVYFTLCAGYLDLYTNAITGPIPTEIGLMTLLSEFVLVIDCHNTLAQSLRMSIRIHLVILMDCFDFFYAAYLDLGLNELTGMIPTEIGLLTLLGECLSWKKEGLGIYFNPNCLAIFHLVSDLTHDFAVL
jgi:hypothetical protein